MSSPVGQQKYLAKWFSFGVRLRLSPCVRREAMQRHAIHSRLILAIVILSVATGFARAVIPSIKPPVAQRVALADFVVVGKVKALDTGLIYAAPMLKIPGVGKIPYQIAVLSVQSMIVGGKEPKEM